MWYTDNMSFRSVIQFINEEKFVDAVARINLILVLVVFFAIVIRAM